MSDVGRKLGCSETSCGHQQEGWNVGEKSELMSAKCPLLLCQNWTQCGTLLTWTSWENR